MTEPSTSIWLECESDKYESISVVAIKPHGWRDAWTVLRGTYVPLVRRVRRVTTAGMARTLKQVWAAPEVRAQLHENPMLRWPLK